MFNFPFQKHAHSPTPQNDTSTTQPSPEPLPWQTDSGGQDDAERRLAITEENEPKRRLIRDARALTKIRKITQGQMAEEMGVPRRTLEEWTQFRRMPKAPGATLLRRWVAEHSKEIDRTGFNNQ